MERIELSSTASHAVALSIELHRHKEGTGRDRTCVVWATTGSFTTKLLPHQKVPGRLELPSPTFAEWCLNHFDYGTMIAPRRVALRSIAYKAIALN